MQVSLMNMAGETVGEVELQDAIFAAPVNEPLMHQALVRQLANARLGTHKTKGRSEVAGGGRKPWRQKGTGRARQGSNTSPLMPGGGRAFGPRPRDYRTDMPKTQRRKALTSALSLKASEQAVSVIEPLRFDVPKTSAMAEVIRKLGLTGKKALLVLETPDENVVKSCRNLPNLRTTLAHQVNPYELLNCDVVLVTEAGLERMKKVFVG